MTFASVSLGVYEAEDIITDRTLELISNLVAIIDQGYYLHTILGKQVRRCLRQAWYCSPVTCLTA